MGEGIIRIGGVNLRWSSEMAGQDAPPTVPPIETGDVRSKQRNLYPSPQSIFRSSYYSQSYWREV